MDGNTSVQAKQHIVTACTCQQQYQRCCLSKASLLWAPAEVLCVHACVCCVCERVDVSMCARACACEGAETKHVLTQKCVHGCAIVIKTACV